ncbi:MAG: elongation factor P hydroxylase [Pseudomonadales bacterium]
MSASEGLPVLTDRQIAGCFNRSLGRQHRVRLIGGAAEPLYLPGEGGFATIRYTRDYPASALHELAHWCIAGRDRRRRVDYGYWYLPPPRTAASQAAFGRVEVPVQALESRLARACGLSFRVSIDDLDAPPDGASGFAEAVRLAAEAPEERLPCRARALLAELSRFRRRLLAPS